MSAPIPVFGDRPKAAPTPKLRALVKFPGNVEATTGIAVTKISGTYTFETNWNDFGAISAIPTSPTSYILTFDTASQSYVMVPSHLLGGAAAGIADAPNDGIQYGRQSGAWTATSTGGGIADAPSDGAQYGRKNAAWTVITSLTDAPSDGTQYARRNAAWTAVPPAGIGDAPSDGTQYARKNGTWASVVSSGFPDYQSNLPAVPAVRSVSQDKLRDYADLRDWAGLDLTGVTDCTVLVQDAVTKTAAIGQILHIPAGKIRLTNAIDWPLDSHIVGTGQASTNHDIKQTWFHLDHVNDGFKAQTQGSSRSMNGLNFFRNQPAGAPGWTPLNCGFDVNLVGCGDVLIENCMFLNPTGAIQVTGNTATPAGNGRITLRNIKGQPLKYGILMTHVYDCVFIDEIHFWPFFSFDTHITDYVIANAQAFTFKRLDNAVCGRLFCYGYWRGVTFQNQPDVGFPGTLPGGSASLFYASSIGCDNTSIGIIVDTGAQVSAQIDHFYTACTGGDAAIQLFGSNAFIVIDTFGAFFLSHAVTMQGSNDLLSIGASRTVGITATEFNMANDSETLRLLYPPKTSSSTVYGGFSPTTGIIETPDWRDYTPVITAASGGTPTASTVIGRYRRIGKTIDYTITIVISSNNGGTGAVRASVLFPSAGNFQAAGRKDGGQVLLVSILGGQSFVSFTAYDGTYPAVDGTVLFVSGTYETT